VLHRTRRVTGIARSLASIIDRKQSRTTHQTDASRIGAEDRRAGFLDAVMRGDGGQCGVGAASAGDVSFQTDRLTSAAPARLSCPGTDRSRRLRSAGSRSHQSEGTGSSRRRRLTCESE
ncbi:unnamed protein product, partial [Mycena citricolor]